MTFNGSGTFNRLYNWVDDRVNGINIRADKFDAEQNGIATGLTNCVTRDGQTTITANLKMSGKKHIDVAPASAVNHYLDVAASQSGKIYHAVTVNADVNSVALTMFPTLSAYTTGMEVRWISSGANTGSANLAIDGLSLTRLVTGTSATLISGQMASAAMQVAIYQGAGKWALQTPSNVFNTLNVVGATNISGAVSVGGILNVNGAVSVASTLVVTGAVSINSTLNVAGVLTATGGLGNSTVDQAALKTASGTVAQVGAGTADFTLPGGAYGFWTRLKIVGGGTLASFNAGSLTSTSFVTNIELGVTTSGTGTAEQTYIQASPPYDMGDGEVMSFIFAMVNNASGLIEAIYHAPDPPWANNGPTDIRPDRMDEKTGKMYKTISSLPSDLSKFMDADFLQESEIEITSAYKNSDMTLIPHPFLNNDLTGKTIVMLDPMSAVVERLEDIKNAGGDAPEIISKYINIGNTELGRGRPDGVMSISVAMK